MAPPRDARSVARIVAVCLVVATLPGAAPAGAVDFDADSAHGGVDDGAAVSDGGAGGTLVGDASGRLGAPVQEYPVAPSFLQEDDDDDEGEGEDDDGDESDDDQDDDDGDGDDDEDDEADEDEEDGEDDDGDEGDDDADDDGGPLDDDDDSGDDDAPDDEGDDEDPIGSLISALSDDSNEDGSDRGGNEDRSEDGGSGDRADGSGGDGAQQGGPDDGADAGDSSGAGADESNEDGTGSHAVDPSVAPDVGDEAVNAAQAETPTRTPAGANGTPAQEGFRVENVSVNRSTVTAGEPVRITATVVNGEGSEATRDVRLRIFGEVVDARTVTVPGGGVRRVSFVRRIVAPGTYEANVGEAGTRFTVAAAEGTVSPGEGTGLPGTTTGAAPGFTGLAAVLAVLAALLIASVRRRG